MRPAVQCVAGNADGEVVSTPVALQLRPPEQQPVPKENDVLEKQPAQAHPHAAEGGGKGREKEKEWANEQPQAQAPSPARLIVRFDRANRTRRTGQSVLLACAPADRSYRLTWLRENTPVDQLPQVR